VNDGMQFCYIQWYLHDSEGEGLYVDLI